MNKSLWISLLGMQLVALSAAADDDVSLGSFVGAHLFNRHLELGAADEDGADSPRNSVAFGVRAGWWLSASFALESELVLVPTQTRGSEEDLTIIAWRAHALFDLLPEDRLRPYALLGLGLMTLSPDNPRVLEEDTDLSAHLGLAFKYDLDATWAVRTDARLIFAPTTTSEYLTNDFEFFLGLTRSFGSANVAAPSDGDGDGVFDPQDQCPESVEDQDGFDDEDGCPDLDNDLDGVSDLDDRCPAEAESLNGIDDQDGCPEADGDGDGIVGSRDACPQQAEDFNGVEDDDGCPEAVVADESGPVEGPVEPK